MADWDSTDLALRFVQAAGLETANDLDATTELYPLLADAQEEVVRIIAGIAPDALMEGPVLMTAASVRKTFKYATVNGNNVHAMGRVQISPRLTSFVSNRDFVGWDEDVHFINEGDRIRIPGDRTYSGDLYARYIPRPVRITSAVGPSLRPVESNVLTVNRAVKRWALQGNQAPKIAAAMDLEWLGADRRGLWPTWALTFKRTHRGGGGLDPALWWLSSPDLTSR